MTKVISRVTGFWLAIGAIVFSMNLAEAHAQAAGVEPEAVEILQRMTKDVSSLKPFNVHAQNTFSC